MKRIAPFMPLLMLAVTFIVHSCSQEAILSKEDAKSLLAFRDSSGIDSTDTIPVDTIPTDTVPHPNDSIWWNIRGLDIAASSVDDTSIVFNIRSTNFFPVNWAFIDLTTYTFPHKWDIGIIKARINWPAVYGHTQAQRMIVHPRYANGNWPLNITLRGVTYSGVIHAEDTSYDISWPHDSIINIHPKHFPRF